MPKFIKKPEEVDAWLWDETRATFNEIGCRMVSCYGNSKTPDLMRDLRIETLEGTMRVNKGDYIIKGVNGEFYARKPGFFKLTYDRV